jgi:hypothetical protein
LPPKCDSLTSLSSGGGRSRCSSAAAEAEATAGGMRPASR